MPPAREIPASGNIARPTMSTGTWMFEDQINANMRGTFLLMVLFILFLTGVVWAAGQLVCAGLCVCAGRGRGHGHFLHQLLQLF